VGRKAAQIDRKFVCEICKVKGYGSRNALNTHIKNKHNLNNPCSTTKSKTKKITLVKEEKSSKKMDEDSDQSSSKSISSPRDVGSPKESDSTSPRDVVSPKGVSSPKQASSGSPKMEVKASPNPKEIQQEFNVKKDERIFASSDNVIIREEFVPPMMSMPVLYLKMNDSFKIVDNETSIEMCLDAKWSSFTFLFSIEMNNIMIEVPFSKVSNITVDNKCVMKIFSGMIRSYLYKDGSWAPTNLFSKNRSSYNFELFFGNESHIDKVINWFSCYYREEFQKIDFDFPDDLLNIFEVLEHDYYYENSISNSNQLFVALKNFI